MMEGVLTATGASFLMPCISLKEDKPRIVEVTWIGATQGSRKIIHPFLFDIRYSLFNSHHTANCDTEKSPCTVSTWYYYKKRLWIRILNSDYIYLTPFIKPFGQSYSQDHSPHYPDGQHRVLPFLWLCPCAATDSTPCSHQTGYSIRRSGRIPQNSRFIIPAGQSMGRNPLSPGGPFKRGHWLLGVCLYNLSDPIQHSAAAKHAPAIPGRWLRVSKRPACWWPRFFPYRVFHQACRHLFRKRSICTCVQKTRCDALPSAGHVLVKTILEGNSY